MLWRALWLVWQQLCDETAEVEQRLRNCQWWVTGRSVHGRSQHYLLSLPDDA